VSTNKTPLKGDACQRAGSVVQEAIGQAERRLEKNPAGVARRRAGELNRAEQMTPERRLEISKHARASRKESA
jgi:hypothetical protein